MVETDLVLIHGFWSSPATWDRLTRRMREDPDLRNLHIHPFGYESPQLRWPGSPARIPDYNDIAQSLPAYLATYTPSTTPVAIVTHSQGGLILQRYLAWMLGEGRGPELGRIRLIVMLSCPNEGSEYLRSIRAVIGLSHRPQAGQLDVLDREVGEARRIVLRQIVNATTLDDRHCPIPIYVYSGRTDNVVLRQSAQSVFPDAEVLPGDHFTILDPATPGHLTLPTLKRHLLNITALPTDSPTDQQETVATNHDVVEHSATVTLEVTVPEGFDVRRPNRLRAFRAWLSNPIETGSDSSSKEYPIEGRVAPLLPGGAVAVAICTDQWYEQGVFPLLQDGFFSGHVYLHTSLPPASVRFRILGADDSILKEYVVQVA